MGWVQDKAIALRRFIAHFLLSLRGSGCLAGANDLLHWQANSLRRADLPTRRRRYSQPMLCVGSDGSFLLPTTVSGVSIPSEYLQPRLSPWLDHHSAQTARNARVAMTDPTLRATRVATDAIGVCDRAQTPPRDVLHADALVLWVVVDVMRLGPCTWQTSGMTRERTTSVNGSRRTRPWCEDVRACVADVATSRVGTPFDQSSERLLSFPPYSSRGVLAYRHAFLGGVHQDEGDRSSYHGQRERARGNGHHDHVLMVFAGERNEAPDGRNTLVDIAVVDTRIVHCHSTHEQDCTPYRRSNPHLKETREKENHHGPPRAKKVHCGTTHSVDPNDRTYIHLGSRPSCPPCLALHRMQPLRFTALLAPDSNQCCLALPQLSSLPSSLSPLPSLPSLPFPCSDPWVRCSKSRNGLFLRSSTGPACPPGVTGVARHSLSSLATDRNSSSDVALLRGIGERNEA